MGGGVIYGDGKGRCVCVESNATVTNISQNLKDFMPFFMIFLQMIDVFMTVDGGSQANGPLFIPLGNQVTGGT